MTDKYRQEEMARAEQNWREAKAAFDKETVYNRRKNEASDAMDFWGGKVDFLAAMARHATV